MGGRIELYIRCNQYVASDCDFVAVNKGAVHVDRHVVSQIDISAIVADKGKPYGHVGADASE